MSSDIQLVRIQFHYSMLTSTITVFCEPSPGSDDTDFLFNPDADITHVGYEDNYLTIEKVRHDGYWWFAGLRSASLRESESGIGTHAVQILTEVPLQIRKLMSPFISGIRRHKDVYSLVPKDSVEFITGRISFNCCVSLNDLRMEKYNKSLPDKELLASLYYKLDRIESELDRWHVHGWGNEEDIRMRMNIVQEEINQLEENK